VRISTTGTALIDTNILVYCYDPRDQAKRAVARKLFQKGAPENELRIPHQVLIEFVSVVTGKRVDGRPLLPHAEAARQAEELLMEFPVLYPNQAVFRMALRGMLAYQLPWYDAHLWAYAEHYGIAEILSEDFSHGRWYGNVRVRNPFVELGLV
jgi:predicted nucleic acid-binding protein